MKVLQDVFTNDELMGEVFKFTLEYNDVIAKVQSSFKSKEAVGQVDIGCGNAFGGTEEEGGEDAPGQEKVIDVAYNYNLVQQLFSKSEFMTYIKEYLKKLKTYLEENGKADRVAGFQKGATEFVKKVASDFDNWEFYTGAKESLDGGIIFTFWEDESASGPMFYYFFDGLKEVKY